MTYKGIDCATPLTAAKAAQIAEAGYCFVGRYLVPATGSLKWKALTKREADDILKTGMQILLVWETTADRMKGGASAGAADAVRAVKLANDMGVPHGTAIYYACDYEAQSADFDAIEAYLRAAAEQHKGRYGVGVYGSFYVVEAMAERRACDYFWQCCAWSYKRVSVYRSVYQHTAQVSIAGVAVDINSCDNLNAAGLWEADMTGEQISKELAEYRYSLAESEWSKMEGAWQALTEKGVVNGKNPQGYMTREEFAAVLSRLGIV